jgi:hypothetical protein
VGAAFSRPLLWSLAATLRGEKPDPNVDELSIDQPRLTPRASVSGDRQGTDATKAGGGVKQGQKDKAEG